MSPDYYVQLANNLGSVDAILFQDEWINQGGIGRDSTQYLQKWAMILFSGGVLLQAVECRYQGTTEQEIVR